MEYLGHGVSRRRLLNNYIVAYSADEDTRAALDTLLIAVREDIQDWDRRRPFLALHDFSQVDLSNGLRDAAGRVAACYTDHFFGRYAIVVNYTARNRAVAYLENMRQQHIAGTFDGSFFHNFDLAMQWLKEGIPVGV
ncbi:MAG: hypothetical protein L0154_10025 [Chloroflexi bacterium]|nr:hypothetical protein [Chloroflexota bacterium]